MSQEKLTFVRATFLQSIVGLVVGIVMMLPIMWLTNRSAVMIHGQELLWYQYLGIGVAGVFIADSFLSKARHYGLEHDISKALVYAVVIHLMINLTLPLFALCAVVMYAVAALSTIIRVWRIKRSTSIT